jgi:hypothetical protein
MKLYDALSRGMKSLTGLRNEISTATQYVLTKILYFGSMTPCFFYMALQPNAGYGLLIHEVFEITHTTHYSR